MLLMQEQKKSESADRVQETAEFYCLGQSFNTIMIRAAECITVCQKQELYLGTWNMQ